jgi:hypothetical protein
MNYCQCGSNPTHYCTSCKPKVLLCKTCIGQHISINLDDSIVPIRSAENNSSHPKCDSCLSAKAVSLLVHNTHTEKICKTCKKGLKYADSGVFLPLKWGEIVTNASELEEYYSRKNVLKKAYQEIDRTCSFENAKASVVKLKESIIAAAEKYSEVKIGEVSKTFEGYTDSIQNIRKEVETQIVKKKPEIDVLGGKLVDSLITKGVGCQLPGPSIIIADKEGVENIIKSIFLTVKLDACRTKQKSVYLFNPGKNSLTRVCLNNLKKEEFLFEKNWTFEASWHELESGDLFFCGGNGMDNSEVLLVQTRPPAIRNLENFTGRSGHSIIEVCKSIYVFGGNKGNHAEKFSFESERWTILSPLPQRIARISTAKLNDEVYMTGSDYDKLLSYQTKEDSYKILGVFFEGYSNKNKIIFIHEENIYCMAGDKLFIANYRNLASWRCENIIDRDWWTYAKPVIHEGSAYFIKYFVRNLWQLNLATFKLIETQLMTIPDL